MPNKLMKTIKTKRNNSKYTLSLKSFEKNLNSDELHNKKKFATELKRQYDHSTIKPTNDFYNYVNKVWLKNISIEESKKYITQIDEFRLKQDEVYYELHKIILNYIKTNKSEKAKNMKNYYNSVIKMNPKSYSLKLAKESIKIVDELINKNDPWALLAWFNKDEMLSANMPLVWSLIPDDKEPDTFRCSIDPIQLILLDINVYYDDGTDVEYKKNYRNKYLKYVKTVFKTLGEPYFNENDVFDVQVELFNALGCEPNNFDSNYNKVNANDSFEKYSFDWNSFALHFGFKTPPRFFLSSNLTYLKCGSKLFIDNWNTPKWRTYWIYLLFRRIIRITSGWEKITYDFYGKFERGQERLNTSKAVSSVLYMTVPYNTFLTTSYIDNYENKQVIDYATTLCNDLKLVFEKILKRNSWMQQKTKEYALKKLSHFKFIFGSPHELRMDPNLKYGNMLYDNLMAINAWRHNQYILLEGNKVVDIPTVDWTNYPVKMSGEQAYIVNASYTPSKNCIYVNLGYLQNPFIDLNERGIEYNLANIGFTIAHEMSHGFDDFGSQYGLDGKLYDWWTDSDKKKYKQIQNDVIKQYEDFALRDGIKFDASIGIGEDLADISGFAICDEYLRDFQTNNNDLTPIKSLSYQAFYIYFAHQQRQHVGKKAISAQLKTNPHPLNKYRCNIPLSRSIIFRSLYNVTSKDKMWWRNTNTIW